MKVKIEIPEGYEIDSIDKLSGEVQLRSSRGPAIDRIKTVADVLADHGITQEQFDQQCQGLEEDEKAYRIIKLLVKSLNEGWLPDWSNSSEYKYYPWFEMRGSSGFRFDVYDLWASDSRVGSRLCFKSRALAEYAGQQFTEVYKQFMTIN